MKKLFWLFVVVFRLFFNPSEEGISQAVTYEQSPGRFGDNLISYIHAKWISYKYDIPLLYNPFVYSDSLVLHVCDRQYTYSELSAFSNIVTLGKNKGVAQSDSPYTLYLVPYFPESKFERENGVSFSGGTWDYFEVDWDDEEFIHELRRVISPIQSVCKMSLPSNCISVAVHIRRGGNHDTPETLPGFPLKFLPEEFYIEQLRRLYLLLGKKPLYVHIFTDDNRPEKIKKHFQKQLDDLDIQFSCRSHGNSDTAHVIEDFFALSQFDCLIHSESNFSFIMSKINDYMVSIYPDSFHREDGRIVYDNVCTNYGTGK